MLIAHVLPADHRYFRVLADTNLVLRHAVAVEHMFAPSGLMQDSSCFEDYILPATERLQGMVSYVRQAGQHVEYESDDWLTAMTLEVRRSVRIC